MGYTQEKNTAVFKKGNDFILSPAVSEGSGGKYWFDIRENNLERINSESKTSLLLIRIVPDMFIVKTLSSISSLLSKDLMRHRINSGNVLGFHIDKIDESKKTAELYNTSKSNERISTKILWKDEVKLAVDKLKNTSNEGFKQAKEMVEEMEQEQIINLLKSKYQIILQGPPGTGKTRLAKQIAKNLTNDDENKFKIIQFHPAYSYEDFVRGIVANTENGQVSYQVEDKILAEMAEKANDDKANKYVLIIDEINRANLPAVLGELIYALEYRGAVVTSMYKKDESRDITLPENLYIIGTMNTADRTVGHIDYAIRRRFAFVNVLPDKSIIKNKKAKTLFDNIKELFDNHLAPDFQKDDVMIGHSYFIKNKDGSISDDELSLKYEYEIKPILKEYVKDGILNKEAEDKINNLNV